MLENYDKRSQKSMENEKIEVEGEAAPVVDLNENESTNKDPNLNFDKQEARENSEKERVQIAEPVEKSFEMSLETINIILSIAAIVLGAITKLMLVSTWTIAGIVFFWLAAVALIGSLAIYIVQVVKDKKVAFNPSFVLLVLAILMTAFFA